MAARAGHRTGGIGGGREIAPRRSGLLGTNNRGVIMKNRIPFRSILLLIATVVLAGATMPVSAQDRGALEANAKNAYNSLNSSRTRSDGSISAYGKPIAQPGNTASRIDANRQMKVAPSARPSGARVTAGRSCVAHEQELHDAQVEVDPEVAADQAQHRVERVARGDHVLEDEELGDEAGEAAAGPRARAWRCRSSARRTGRGGRVP